MPNEGHRRDLKELNALFKPEAQKVLQVVTWDDVILAKKIRIYEKKHNIIEGPSSCPESQAFFLSQYGQE